MHCNSNFYNSQDMPIHKTCLIVYLNVKLVGVTEIMITIDLLSILKNNTVDFFCKTKIGSAYFIFFSISIFITDMICIDEGVYERKINAYGTSNLYNYVFVPLRIIVLLVFMITYVKLIISLLNVYNKFLERKKKVQIRTRGWI